MDQRQRWKRYDIITASSNLFDNNNAIVASSTDITVAVGANPRSIGMHLNYPLQGPAEFAKLMVVAKLQENIDKK